MTWWKSTGAQLKLERWRKALQKSSQIKKMILVSFGMGWHKIQRWLKIQLFLFLLLIFPLWLRRRLSRRVIKIWLSLKSPTCGPLPPWLCSAWCLSTFGLDTTFLIPNAAAGVFPSPVKRLCITSVIHGREWDRGRKRGNQSTSSKTQKVAYHFTPSGIHKSIPTLSLLPSLFFLFANTFSTLLCLFCFLLHPSCRPFFSSSLNFELFSQHLRRICTWER